MNEKTNFFSHALRRKMKNNSTEFLVDYRKYLLFEMIIRATTAKEIAFYRFEIRKRANKRPFVTHVTIKMIEFVTQTVKICPGNVRLRLRPS